MAVRIYSREKTIADCFKYRNKAGLSVALEALKEGLHQGCKPEKYLHSLISTGSRNPSCLIRRRYYEQTWNQESAGFDNGC